MASDSLNKVTEEQFTAIRADLEKLLEVGQKEGETLEAYALRLAKRAHDGSVVSDEDWETLAEQTQKWINGMIDADEKGQPLVLPPSGGNGKDDAKATAPAAAPKPAPKSSAPKAAKAAAPKAAEKAPAKTAAKPAAKPAKAAAPKPAPKAPAKPAAKPAAKAAAPKAAAAGAVRRGRPGRVPLEAKVKILVTPNPHRPGTKSHGYYQLYEKGAKRKNGISLGEVLDAGVPRAEVAWHESRGIIKLEG